MKIMVTGARLFGCNTERKGPDVYAPKLELDFVGTDPDSKTSGTIVIQCAGISLFDEPKKTVTKKARRKK